MSKIIFLLFVIIGTLFASCTMEEEAIKNHNYSKEIKIYQKTFDELLAMGIKIDVRKVPTDSPENFDEILKKAKSELKP